MRYVWAVTLVALGLLVGFVFQPAFGRSQAYATFFPVVLFAAYALGPKPAVMAMGLSAAVAYWCLVPPDFQWKWDTQVGAALAFFLSTSAVGIYLIDRLLRPSRSSRSSRSSRHLKPADLARVNAVIFADLSARNATAGRLAFVSTTPLAAACPSERSFDIACVDGEAVELDQVGGGQSSPRKRDVQATGERGATIH